MLIYLVQIRADVFYNIVICILTLLRTKNEKLFQIRTFMTKIKGEV